MVETQTPQYEWQKPKSQQFDLGDVFSRAWDVFRARFKGFFVFMLIAVGLPTILVTAAPLLFGVNPTDPTSLTENIGLYTTISLIGGIISLIMQILAPAALIYASLKSFNGEFVSVGSSLRMALSRFWGLIGMAILGGLAMIVGFIFFIVPGVILACGWYVVTAALIMEKKSATDSLSRSWQLTNGYKGQMFAILIAGLVITMVVSGLATIPVLMMAGSADPILGIAVQTPKQVVVSAILQGIATAGAMIFSAVLVASAYFELRKVKEGVNLESIAEIFA